MTEPTLLDLLDENIGSSSGDGLNFSGLLDAIKKQFGGTGYGGEFGQIAAFGGLSALLNKLMTQRPDPVGYQGGIPQYTVNRVQTPMSEQRPVSYESIPPKEGEVAPAVMRQIPYRPGQGGITYFKPIQYNYTGQDLSPPTLPTPPAQGGTQGGQDKVVPAAAGGYMPGGIAMLAGGRYLRGPGDGVSDSIPAKFEQSGQPARLADGEFVIDARTVSEIGNGSSEAGARKLYAMMDRVHKARKTAKRGKPSGADKYLPK